MTEPTKVDLRARKTEAGWVAASDHFWLAATPKLFEWLRWAVMLAAVSYIARRSDSLVLKIFLGVCYGSLLVYYQAFFGQFEFENLPWLKSSRAQRVASIVLSALLGLGTYWLVRLSVDALVDAHP